MNNQIRNTNNKYDLEERTAILGEKIISFSKKARKNTTTKPIISQFIRAGTSIGANYCEANDAESKMDFRHKIGICKKESKETMYWSRMLATALPEFKDELKLF